MVFSCEYCEIFKNSMLKNTCERLLFNFHKMLWKLPRLVKRIHCSCFCVSFVFRKEQALEEFRSQEKFWLYIRMGHVSHFTGKHDKTRLSISKIQYVNCKSLKQKLNLHFHFLPSVTLTWRWQKSCCNYLVNLTSEASSHYWAP